MMTFISRLGCRIFLPAILMIFFSSGSLTALKVFGVEKASGSNDQWTITVHDSACGRTPGALTVTEDHDVLYKGKASAKVVHKADFLRHYILP